METLIQHCKLLTVYGHIQYQFNGTKHCWSQANTKNMNLKSDNLDTTLMQHIAHQIKIGTFFTSYKTLPLSIECCGSKPKHPFD